MGSGESFDFFVDAALELEELEPLVDLDEEEAELFEAVEDFAEVCLSLDDTTELLLSLLALVVDEEELSGRRGFELDQRLSFKQRTKAAKCGEESRRSFYLRVRRQRRDIWHRRR